jgi:hypothetical protein
VCARHTIRKKTLREVADAIGLATPVSDVYVSSVQRSAAVSRPDRRPRGRPNNIYFADSIGGLIERTSYAINAKAILLARGQVMPSAMAVDGARLYWSTADCAINATSL